MVEYTLFEKIKTIFNLITSSPLFLILLFGILLMIIDIFFISKTDKKTKIIYIVVSLLVIILFMNSYLHSIFNIFDTIAKNIVSIIYFPTILQYILMLIISLIILIISVISKKINKIIKRINIFVLIINSFIFFLILDQISNSNVDLSNKVSIYSNTILMILLELSIAIFVVWIIGLILYKIIKKISPKKDGERVMLNSQTFYEDSKLSKKTSEIQKEIVVIKEKPEEMFTLKEYKQMKEILEEIKSKNNESIL